ncbi:MAG: VWA domain-containing protein [Microcystis aeruginosa G11-01]|nr:VWA domain-containing protein [Microcystis aeruginosa G11-01]
MQTTILSTLFIKLNTRAVISAFLLPSVLLLSSCSEFNKLTSQSTDTNTRIQVKLLFGSALGDFCQQAAVKFNQQKPKLDNGQEFYISCEIKGSGDVVADVVAQSQRFKAGKLAADAPELPSIISVDGEIYQNQLIFQINQIFPGQNYIPAIADSPLIASSPMVFMTSPEVAQGLSKLDTPFKTFANANVLEDISPTAGVIPFTYVQTAPTRSNSGLQSLVAQYAEVSGKRPEQLTVADVQTYQNQVKQIQSKVTRYGVSTNALAKSMVTNGQFWAAIGSVYESSVITSNSNLQAGQPRYQAVYPKSTFSSNMRAIVPNTPWMDANKKAAAQKVVTYLQSNEAQQILTELGLRPGTPGVALGAKFTADFGVDPQAKYDSYRPPQPLVVEAMIKSWREQAKKPSLVMVVIDTSGSMNGAKIAAMQSTLQSYVNSLTPKDTIAMMDFNTVINPPVLIKGTPEGKAKGLQYVASLEADGGTKLYDATLAGRNWLQQNLRKDSINAVLVLTDGADSGSTIEIDQLLTELKKSGFETEQRISVFTIGYGDEQEFNPKALQDIAQQNAGYYTKGEPETIARLLADIQVEF